MVDAFNLNIYTKYTNREKKDFITTNYAIN